MISSDLVPVDRPGQPHCCPGVPEGDGRHGPDPVQVRVTGADEAHGDVRLGRRRRGQRAEHHERVRAGGQASVRCRSGHRGCGLVDPLERLGDQQFPLPGPDSADVIGRDPLGGAPAGPGVVGKPRAGRHEHHQWPMLLCARPPPGHRVAKGVDALDGAGVVHTHTQPHEGSLCTSLACAGPGLIQPRGGIAGSGGRRGGPQSRPGHRPGPRDEPGGTAAATRWYAAPSGGRESAPAAVRPRCHGPLRLGGDRQRCAVKNATYQ